MIKTKINEGRYVDAFSKLAQSFNIRSKPKVEKPSTTTQNKEDSSDQKQIDKIEPVNVPSQQENKLEQSFNNLEKIIQNLYFVEYKNKFGTSYDFYYNPFNDVYSSFEKINPFVVRENKDRTEQVQLFIIELMLVGEYNNNRQEVEREEIKDNVKKVPDTYKKRLLSLLRTKTLKISDKAKLNESLVIRWKQLAGIRG